MANQELLGLRPEGYVQLESPASDKGLQNNLYPTLLRRFSPATYSHNRDLMHHLAMELGKIEPLDGGDFLNSFYPVTSVDTPLAQRLMNAIAAAPSVPLHGALPSNATLADIFRASRSKEVTVGSPSHATDEQVLNRLFEGGVDPASVAMIVFDTHFDGLYPTEKQSLRSTFQGGLLERGLGHLAVIGVPDDFAQTYKNGGVLNWQLDEEEWKEYLELQDRLGLNVPFDERRSALLPFLLKHHPILHSVIRDLTHRHVVLPHQNQVSFIARDAFYRDSDLQEQLHRLMDSIRRKPTIKYLYLSVDIDVLDLFGERLTATTYSPFATLLAFGVNQVKKVSSSWDADQFANEVMKFQGKQILTTPRDGLKSSQLIGALGFIREMAQQSQIAWGVPYGEYTVLGSIMEMNGHDLDGNTQAMVGKIDAALRK